MSYTIRLMCGNKLVGEHKDVTWEEASGILHGFGLKRLEVGTHKIPGNYTVEIKKQP